MTKDKNIPEENRHKKYKIVNQDDIKMTEDGNCIIAGNKTEANACSMIKD